MLTGWRFAPVGFLGLVVACGSGCSASDGDDSDESEEAVSAQAASAALEIHPLDIWARALDMKDVKLSVTRNGTPVKVDPKSATTVFIRRAGTYAIHLEAPKHEPLDVTVAYDGGAADDSAQLDASASRGAYSFGHVQRDIAGKRLNAHVVYLGLRHKWFSAEGRPARGGNDVQLLMDGEEAWATVKKDLVRATKTVNISTWWWESDFELTRAPIGATDDERWRNTILGTLESIPATKRVLVGEFYGQDTLLQLLNTDSKLRAHATAPGDHFEMMSQANETRGKFRFEIPAFSFGDRVKPSAPEMPFFAADARVSSVVPPHDVDLTKVPFGLDLPLASYHQKFLTVDEDIAFVGGMNLRHVDWDSSQHEIYDSRRMKLGAWDITRNMVAAKNRTPDGGPRKDYMVRIQGPAAADVADIFHERWEELRRRQVRYSAGTSDFVAAVAHDIAPRDGGIEVQVTATLPAPFHEHAIAETWFNAVNNAEKFIFIEDQYFRMPMIHEALIKRMDEKPELKLVVVTKPVGTMSPECVQAYAAGELFQQRYPSRFLSIQLRVFDGEKVEFADMDVHSKMLIVDDFFMSVGSANKNNRGMVYEAELNVAVADPVVGSYRKRILTNILGREANDDANGWFEQLSVYSRANDVAYEAGGTGLQPRGFAYGLRFASPAACQMQSIGPDAT
jgi:PLD-like domain/Phospholipase D Active site motif